jgi:hypothetical protein
MNRADDDSGWGIAENVTMLDVRAAVAPDAVFRNQGADRLECGRRQKRERDQYRKQ